MTKSKKLITGLVALAIAALIPALPAQARGTKKTKAKAAATAPSSPVDLNSATAAQLQAIPGVSAATAKKIIANRPYSSAADLAKAHLSKKSIEKITPYVTASGSAAAAPAEQKAEKRSRRHSSKATALAPAAAAAAAPAAAATTAPADESAASPAPANPNGMVWVNLNTKVYHRSGDRWYGKTKHGKYMTEKDAIAAGYRAAESGEHKH